MANLGSKYQQYLFYNLGNFFFDLLQVTTREKYLFSFFSDLVSEYQQSLSCNLWKKYFFFFSDLVSEYQQYQEASVDDEELHEEEEGVAVEAE